MNAAPLAATDKADVPTHDGLFPHRELSDPVGQMGKRPARSIGAALHPVAGRQLARSGDRCAVWQALIRGAALTLVLLVALGSWMLVAFDRFFTLFHGVFFEQGTWTFYYTDTLIRLFPFRFWEDAGLLVAGGVTLLSLGLLIVSVVNRRRCVAR